MKTSFTNNQGSLAVVVSLVTKSCPFDFCDTRDCSPSGSSVHRISQARVLEWAAISFSRGSSQLRDQTHISWTADLFFTDWATRESNQGSNCNVRDEIKHWGQPHGNEFCGYCYYMKSFYQLISQQQLRKKGHTWAGCMKGTKYTFTKSWGLYIPVLGQRPPKTPLLSLGRWPAPLQWTYTASLCYCKSHVIKRLKEAE